MNNLPKEYTPISAWGYFGYSILFNLPVIGLILLIIFSLSNENINRRNYARSYFCVYILLIIIFALLAVFDVSIPGFSSFLNSIKK